MASNTAVRTVYRLPEVSPTQEAMPYALDLDLLDGLGADLPGPGLFTGREPFESARCSSSRADHRYTSPQPTRHPFTLYRAKRLTVGRGSPLGLSWDFRPHQRARP